MKTKPEDTDVVWISIPLDGKTADRLRDFADSCHAMPETIASSLLHDVLEDDAHCNVECGDEPRPIFN